MKLSAHQTIIFEGRYDDEVYTYALSYDDAKSQVLRCYAYGCPDEACYVKGNGWALSDDDTGWRIVAKSQLVYRNQARLSGDPSSEDTAHVIWECPFCKRCFSEDCTKSDEPPLLVICDCDNKTKLFLVEY